MRGLPTIALALVACARPAPVAPSRAEAAPATEDAPGEERAERLASTIRAVEWPSALLVGEHEGETFFRHPDEERGYAWVEPGMVLSARGHVQGGRVRAATDGPLRIRGWIDVSSLGAVVLRRGRVSGTPLYVAPGDRVAIVDAREGIARVRAAARLGHPEARTSPELTGEYPIARLGAVMFGSGAGPTPGRPAQLRRAAGLRIRPGDEPAVRLPALDPPLGLTVLREGDEWTGVRVGIGPYLVGYVPSSALLPPVGARKQSAPPTPEVLDPRGRASATSTPSVTNPWADDSEETGEEGGEESPLPPRLRAAVVRPVRAVRTGTRVRVEGSVVAVFRRPGWAVELERRGDEVEILGAIDERATVRGMVPASRLFEP